MIKLEDLSPEDKAQLLQQARLIVEQENINKDAITVYRLKRKDLIEKHINEIHEELHMNSFNKQGLRQRYISIVNYLFKFAVDGEYNSKDHVIANTDEWYLFEKVNTIVKDTFITCYNLRK